MDTAPPAPVEAPTGTDPRTGIVADALIDSKASKTRFWARKSKNDKDNNNKKKSNDNDDDEKKDEVKVDLSHLSEAQQQIIHDQIDAGPPRKGSYTDLLRFGTAQELSLNGLGLLAAIAAGVCQPLMIFIFGDIITAFVDYSTAAVTGADLTGPRERLLSKIDQSALYLVYIGIAMWVATYLYISIYIWNGERISRRIRQAYLKSALRQNIGYWDKLGAGEVTTRLTTDMATVQRGLSEKLPIGAQYTSQFAAGFVVALIKNWKLALILSSILPGMMIAGFSMSIFEAKYKTKSSDCISVGASLSEEVFSSIRTVVSYEMQKRLSLQFDKSNKKAMGYGRKISVVIGAGVCSFYFLSLFGICAGTLVWHTVGL